MYLNATIFAVFVGILPALFWLWFWRKEDRLHPEPRRLIAYTFLAGMAAAIIAVLFEQAVQTSFEKLNIKPLFDNLLLLLSLSLIEESFKYFAAKKSALSRQEFDEPIDALIYLITAALGFAAMENVFFLASTFIEKGVFTALAVGNLRFIGTTLVHILSSSAIGAAIAFSFYKRKDYKLNLFLGFTIAIFLHTAFNYLILKSSDTALIKIFLPYWILVVFLMLVFEKVKVIKPEKKRY
jgi:RsiW-degrading membrane proteinase PrsW (M82 family)